MKTKAIIGLASMLLIAILLTMQAQALKPGIDFSGIHFNLNLHGVPDGEKAVPSDSGEGRHSIFVPLSGTYELYIAVDGTEWLVTDCDATDADGEVRIILPREVWEDTNDDGILDTKIGTVRYYEVYVVGLGKPGENQVVIDPEATFTDSGATVVFHLETLTVEGHKNGKIGGKGGGQPNWYNATDLFFADVTLSIIDPETGLPIEYVDTWIFDIPELIDYWWDVNNSGVRLMQVRFYPVFNGNGNGNNQ